MLKRMLLVLCLVTLLAAAPTFAQETDPTIEAQSTEQTASGPSSVTTAVLLLGIAAVLAVGGYVIRRENAHKEVD